MSPATATSVSEHPIWARLDLSNLEELNLLPLGGFVRPLQNQAQNVWTVSAIAWLADLKIKTEEKLKRVIISWSHIKKSGGISANGESWHPSI